MKICHTCKQKKEISEFYNSRSDCKKCSLEISRKYYWSHPITKPKKCTKCHVVSMDFQRSKATCRKCRAVQLKDYRVEKRTDLGQALIAMWKAGYEYETAVKMIKNNKQNGK